MQHIASHTPHPHRAIVDEAVRWAAPFVTLVRVQARLELREEDFGVEFEDRLPGQPRGQFLVTTDSLPLDGPGWPPKARRNVNRLLDAGRGRALFCIERGRGTRAALAYSLRCHPKGPVLLYALAINGLFVDDSVYCAALLKVHLHRLGVSLFRVGDVLYDAGRGDPKAYARDVFRFRNAARHDCARPGGTLLTQNAPP